MKILIRYLITLSILILGMMSDTAYAAWIDLPTNNRWITGGVALIGLVGKYSEWFHKKDTVIKCEFTPASTQEQREKLIEVGAIIEKHYPGRWLVSALQEIVLEYAEHRATYHNVGADDMWMDSYLTPNYNTCHTVTSQTRFDERDQYEKRNTLQNMTTQPSRDILLKEREKGITMVTISPKEDYVSYVTPTAVRVRRLSYIQNKHHLSDVGYDASYKGRTIDMRFLNNRTLAILNNKYKMSVFNIPELSKEIDSNCELKRRKEMNFKNALHCVKKQKIPTNRVLILSEESVLVAYDIDGVPTASIVVTSGVVQKLSYQMFTDRGGYSQWRIGVLSNKRVVFRGDEYISITQLSDDCTSIVNQRSIKLPEDARALSISYFGDYVALKPRMVTNQREHFSDKLKPLELLVNSQKIW